MNAPDAARWQRIGALFDQISALEPGERAAALSIACADDAQLHEEVTALLRQDESDDDERLAAPARVAASWADNADPDASDDAAGRRIGPWRVVRKLGRGGMGVVYLVERADGQFEQRAALKLIRSDDDRRALQRRFLRERQILARLEHPHIARLLDGGIDSEGQPYFAMEFVDGAPLLAYAAERHSGLDERLRLFLGVCAAVQFAHRQLVVHLDIKPSNVLVARDGSVKLLDFGIAALLEGRSGDENESCLHAFTPSYAAPEQLRGEAVTTATDVYALGALLYELLSGARPYASEADANADPWLRLHSGPLCVPPSSAARTRAKLPPPTSSSDTASPLPPVAGNRLRGDLDLIVLTALRREPERRYASVEALAEDVQRFQAGLPIHARPDSASYRTRKFVARHRAGVALAALAVLALVAALATALLQAEHARDQAREARASAELARQQTARAESVRTFLVDVFEQATPDANKGLPLTAHQLLEKGEQQIQQSTDGQPALQADAAALIADLYQSIGDFARADVLLKRALASSADARVPRDVKARVLVGIAAGEDEEGSCDDALVHARAGIAALQPDAPGAAETLATAHDAIAHCLTIKGEMSAAENLLRDALRQDGAALGARNETVGDEWVQLGNVLAARSSYDEAEAAYRNGLQIWRALFGDDSNHVAHALNELSNALDDKGDLAGAEAALRQSLKIRMQTVGADHHDTIAVESNLLSVLEAEGRFSEALPERLRLRGSAAVQAQLHPQDLISSYLNTGRDYRELGQLDQAEADLRHALGALDATTTTHNQQRINVLRCLGEVYTSAGRYREAEAVLRQALASQLESGPTAAQRVALARLDLGNLLRRQHRYDEAIDQLSQSNNAFDSMSHVAGPGHSSALAALAEAQLDKGDLDGARATAQSALTVARRDLPDRNYQLGTSLFALARADLALGQAGEAEPLLREAIAVRTPPHPAGDSRALELQVALVEALMRQKRTREADALRAHVTTLLKPSARPYDTELLARLTTTHEPIAHMTTERSP